ncbi:hypothetical protein SEPCBS119000_002457 [Sporothrix epigloea]|uniref:Protein kinase domain-containing protein n=1 Tax=Sporothrix epigloea TaxID=1892477 RepID=A0ABP0DKD0_9PEZI
MLFCLDDIDSVPEDRLRQTKKTQKEYNVRVDSISPPIERLDGKTDLWAPRYLCSAHPLSAFTKYTAGFKIKLSDLGSAYFFDDPPTKDTTPRGLRAPETILTHTMNNALDIWSFGCLVFELITGQRIFNLCSFGRKMDDEDQHLLELNACVGALPEEIMKQWKRSSLYFTPQGKLYNCMIGRGEGGTPHMFEQQSLEERFDAAAPDLDEKEAMAVKALIRRILQYDPAKRPTPSELLQDPWFRNIDSAGNLAS